jgi:hypothetical protein
VNDRYWAMGLQCYMSSVALYARRLPPGYQIALWFDSEGISTQLLDPDETRIDTESPQDFAKLCELAQADAKRRASDDIQ